MMELIRQRIEESQQLKQAMLEDEPLCESLAVVAERCVEALRGGHKILAAGNGGSAADAQHMVAELVGRFEMERHGLPAIALTTNSSSLTAIANDYGYDAVFRRQLQALGTPGDLFFGISTSGNSGNVLQAVEACAGLGVTPIGLTGQDGGRMATACEWCLCVPAVATPRIQEGHILAIHILCELIENQLFGGQER